MARNKHAFNIRSELAKLSNPLPTTADPEDFIDSAKLTDVGDTGETIAVGSSALRRKVAPAATENEVRYQGVKTSRAKLDLLGPKGKRKHAVNEEEEDDVSNDSGEESAEDSASEGDNDAGTGADDSFLTADTADDSDDASEDDEDAEDDDGEDEDEDEDEDEESKDDGSKDDGSDGNEDQGITMVTAKTAKGTSEVRDKGRAVTVQQGLWDTLIDVRIGIQKPLLAVNQLPQADDWSSVVAHCSDDCKQAVHQAQQGLKKLLDSMVELQTALLVRNPDTRAIVRGGGEQKAGKRPRTSSGGGGSDEEIDSDEAEGLGSDGDGEGGHRLSRDVEKNLYKKIKMADYPQFLAQRHKDFVTFRNQVIQKWYDRTRVSATKVDKGFSAFEQSAVKQIEKILSDRPRLIRRTQTKRSTYRIVGQSTAAVSEKKPADNGSDEGREAGNEGDDAAAAAAQPQMDTEIFDDDDFYHQLLADMLQRTPVDVNDPAALSRHWLELQKFRTKAKKKVDTKASKGRKIRYDVHPKLVNFMAPVDRSTWSDSQRTELFASLFGQQIPSQQQGASSSATSVPDHS